MGILLLKFPFLCFFLLLIFVYGDRSSYYSSYRLGLSVPISTHADGPCRTMVSSNLAFDFFQAIILALHDISTKYFVVSPVIEYLEELSLSISIHDTAQTSLQTVGTLIDMIYKDSSVWDAFPRLLAVIGPNSSDPAQAAAQLLYRFRIPNVSFAATSAALSDKSSYPYFTRTVPPDDMASLALADLIRRQNWDRIAILADTTDYAKGLSSGVISSLTSLYDAEEAAWVAGGSVGDAPTATIISSYSFLAGTTMTTSRSEDIDSQLEQISLSSDFIRVILLFTTAADSLEVLTLAQARELVNPGWVWLASDTVAGGSMITTSDSAALFHGVLAIRPLSQSSQYDSFISRWREVVRDTWQPLWTSDPSSLPVNTKLLKDIVDQKGVTGLTSSQWDSACNYASQAYDAAILVACGVLTSLYNTSGTADPSDITADNVFHGIVNPVFENDSGTSFDFSSFTGASGVVTLDSNGDAAPQFEFVSFNGVDAAPEVVAFYNVDSSGNSVFDTTSSSLSEPYWIGVDDRGWDNAPEGSVPLCDRGYQLNVTSNVCELCPAGTMGLTDSESGQGYCDICTDGSFNPNLGSSSCQVCSAGYSRSLAYEVEIGISESNQGIQCYECVEGTYSDLTGSTSCTTCSAGLYSSYAATSCSLCPIGYYSKSAASSSCISCPSSKTTLQVGSTFETQCTCGVGLYWDRKNDRCINCPSYLVCSGGNDVPRLTSGYWAPEVTDLVNFESLDVYLCETNYCPGGAAGTCSGGHVGIACGICPDGEIEDGNGYCTKCSTFMQPYIFLPFLIIIFFIIFSFVHLMVPEEISKRMTAIDAIFAGFMILFNLGQILYVAVGVNLDWPDFVSTPGNIIGVVDLESLNMSCSFSNNYTLIYGFVAFVPLLFPISAVILYFLSRSLDTWIKSTIPDYDEFDENEYILQELKRQTTLIQQRSPQDQDNNNVSPNSPSSQINNFSNLRHITPENNTNEESTAHLKESEIASRPASFNPTTNNTPSASLILTPNHNKAFDTLITLQNSVGENSLKPSNSSCGGQSLKNTLVSVPYLSRLVIWLTRKLRSGPISLDKLMNTCGVLLNALFITIIQNSIGLFNCYKHPNGKKSISGRSDIICYESEWFDTFPVAVVVISIYIGVLYVCLMIVILKAPGVSLNPRNIIRLQFIFQDVRQDRYWYFAVALTRDMLVLIPLLVLSDSPMLQIIVMALVLLIGLIIQTKVWPWGDRIVNLLDMMATSLIVIVLVFNVVRNFFLETKIMVESYENTILSMQNSSSSSTGSSLISGNVPSVSAAVKSTLNAVISSDTENETSTNSSSSDSSSETSDYTVYANFVYYFLMACMIILALVILTSLFRLLFRIFIEFKHPLKKQSDVASHLHIIQKVSTAIIQLPPPTLFEFFENQNFSDRDTCINYCGLIVKDLITHLQDDEASFIDLSDLKSKEEILFEVLPYLDRLNQQHKVNSASFDIDKNGVAKSKILSSSAGDKSTIQEDNSVLQTLANRSMNGFSCQTSGRGSASQNISSAFFMGDEKNRMKKSDKRISVRRSMPGNPNQSVLASSRAYGNGPSRLSARYQLPDSSQIRSSASPSISMCNSPMQHNNNFQNTASVNGSPLTTHQHHLATVHTAENKFFNGNENYLLANSRVKKSNNDEFCYENGFDTSNIQDERKTLGMVRNNLARTFESGFCSSLNSDSGMDRHRNDGLALLKKQLLFKLPNKDGNHLSEVQPNNNVICVLTAKDCIRSVDDEIASEVSVNLTQPHLEVRLRNQQRRQHKLEKQKKKKERMDDIKNKKGYSNSFQKDVLSYEQKKHHGILSSSSKHSYDENDEYDYDNNALSSSSSIASPVSSSSSQLSSYEDDFSTSSNDFVTTTTQASKQKKANRRKSSFVPLITVSASRDARLNHFTHAKNSTMNSTSNFNKDNTNLLLTFSVRAGGVIPQVDSHWAIFNPTATDVDQSHEQFVTSFLSKPFLKVKTHHHTDKLEETAFSTSPKIIYINPHRKAASLIPTPSIPSAIRVASNSSHVVDIIPDVSAETPKSNGRNSKAEMMKKTFCCYRGAVNTSQQLKEAGILHPNTESFFTNDEMEGEEKDLIKSMIRRTLTTDDNDFEVKHPTNVMSSSSLNKLNLTHNTKEINSNIIMQRLKQSKIFYQVKSEQEYDPEKDDIVLQEFQNMADDIFTDKLHNNDKNLRSPPQNNESNFIDIKNNKINQGNLTKSSFPPPLLLGGDPLNPLDQASEQKALSIIKKAMAKRKSQIGTVKINTSD